MLKCRYSYNYELVYLPYFQTCLLMRAGSQLPKKSAQLGDVRFFLLTNHCLYQTSNSSKYSNELKPPVEPGKRDRESINFLFTIEGMASNPGAPPSEWGKWAPKYKSQVKSNQAYKSEV
jgi:hypothetical protein